MKICLAPMDGITDCAYRCVCKRVFEQVGSTEDELMLWTEFMSAEGYCHNPPGVIKHLLKTDYEPQLIAQIFGGDPDALTRCAIEIEQRYHYAGVELNMGCPSPSVMKCDAGSAMLKDKKKTLGILQHMSESLNIPFSLKTRAGLTQEDKEEQFSFLMEAAPYVWMIILHGRTYKQSHAGDVDREFIYRLKQALPDKVIIGNGGIRSYQDARERLTSTDGKVTLDGIMIAQSAIGNPWILTPHTPTPTERVETILYHLDLSMACELYFIEEHAALVADPNRSLIMPTLDELHRLFPTITDHPCSPSTRTPVEFRKYLFNYISGLPDNKKLKQKIIAVRDYVPLKHLLEEYFASLPN